MLQGINLKRKEKERERMKERMTRGDQASVSEAQNYFPGELIYLELYIENNRICRVMQGQQS